EAAVVPPERWRGVMGRALSTTRSCCVACSLVLAAHSARAHVLATDSIVCAPPTLVGQAGGFGWDGHWSAHPAHTAVFVPTAGSLSGPLGLPTFGGALYYDGTLLQAGHPLASHYGARIYRPLAVDPGSAANGFGLTETHTTFFANQQYGYGAPGTSVWL